MQKLEEISLTMKWEEGETVEFSQRFQDSDGTIKLYKGKLYLETLKEEGGTPPLISPERKTEVMCIERKLEKILNKQELLTYEDLEFIAKELLPSSSIPLDCLESLESRVRTDVMERIDLLKKVDPISIFLGLLEEEIKSIESSREYSVTERIRKYLWITVTAEFGIQHAKLFERWEKEKEYSYDQYLKDLAHQNEELYSLIK